MTEDNRKHAAEGSLGFEACHEQNHHPAIGMSQSGAPRRNGDGTRWREFLLEAEQIAFGQLAFGPVGNHEIDEVPEALRKAEAFGTQHGCEIEAREAIGALRDAKKDAPKSARALAKLFSSIADLLEHPSLHDPAGLLISPDAVKEYELLVGRVARAVFDDRSVDKRARRYIENRIILAAGRVVNGTFTIEQAGQRVVELTHDDVHTRPYVEKLASHELELVACLKSAADRKPKNGKFPPPGTHADPYTAIWNRRAIEKYDAAIDQLCTVLGLRTAKPATRASELSRIRRKRAPKP